MTRGMKHLVICLVPSLVGMLDYLPSGYIDMPTIHFRVHIEMFKKIFLTRISGSYATIILAPVMVVGGSSVHTPKINVHIIVHYDM